MKPSPTRSVVLRAATVWGTTVLSTRMLAQGESLRLGGEGAIGARPDGTEMAELPIRAVAAGWELDPRGATGGEIVLRGRREDPAELGRTGAPIPVVPGDYGLVQYGTFSIFFQFTDQPEPLKKRQRSGWSLVLSFLFSCIAVGGGLALIWAITTPPVIPKPLELTSQAELAKRFNVNPEELVAPPEPAGDEAAGPKDPGAKDKKDQGGGKRKKGDEGKVGRNAPAEKTEDPGDIGPALGGMAEALSSDVGDEVKKTLSTISSVADALGGLRSENLVLGQGMGLGLRGGGASAGGTADTGVPFGAGTLDTGFGVGVGGGLGKGKGGPGGRGRGGVGRGGGTGPGEGGSGERRIAGKEAARPGQGLSPEQIRRVVVSRMGAFQACYEIALGRDPNLKGNVGVRFSISPGGSVSSVSISNSSLSNPRVEGCLTRQFSRLRFPTADLPTNGSFPFVFRPSKR